MEKIKIQVIHDKLIVGEIPRLVIDLNGGENYLETENQKIPYRKKIGISRDLIQGKRSNVMQTAMMYYYQQASRIAEGYKKIADYHDRINIDVKEIR